MVMSVEVVCEGYLRRENNVLLEAHSTSSLILGGPHKILVDTSTPRLRDRLLSGLGSLDLGPQDIDMVVCTHLHPDHVGNNDLFPGAVKLARVEEGPEPSYHKVRSDVEIVPGVRLFHTPGHTRGSMSVWVDTPAGRCVIAGDAIPLKENFERWTPPLINYDEDAALKSMRRIAYLADRIIPGHGAAFAVDLSGHQR